MKNKITTILLLSILFVSCVKEYNCLDNPIEAHFINYSFTDLDTLILRKFKAGDDFNTLIDSIFIITGSNGRLYNFNDSSKALWIDSENGIRFGYDWQLCIPSKNKTISISKIISEKTQGKRHWGIFSMDPPPPCINKIYSCWIDSNFTDFSGGYQYYFNINN